nr:hypothetical protein [Tanacetum cinerariifolium]
MDTESEPFEDLVETEAPKSPHTVAPPTSLPDSTPPTLVSILRRTARMVVCVPPTMSPGLYASIAEVAAMFDSAFRKRFRSSYESSPSSSSPDLPSRKRYRGTSELVEDDESYVAIGILFIPLALRYSIAILSHFKYWHINWVYTLNLRAHELYVDLVEYHFQMISIYKLKQISHSQWQMHMHPGNAHHHFHLRVQKDYLIEKEEYHAF